MLCVTLLLQYIVHPVLFPACQTRYQDKYIDGNNRAIISDIETAEACWELCLSNIGYTCNSIDYGILLKKCYLSTANSRDEELVDGWGYIYIERCVDG